MDSTISNYQEKKLKQEVLSLRSKIKSLQKENNRLELRNSFFGKILNAIPSDLVVFDINHRYQFINPQAIDNESIRNWLINKTDFDYCKLKGKPFSLAKKRRKVFNEVVKGKKEVSFEERMLNEKGEFIWIYRTMFPIIIKEKVEGVIGYAYIITHLKQMEKDLENAQKEAEVSIKAKESFLANMSHEIRTPMNAILGMSQLLSEADLSKKHRRFLEGITKSADNLIVIINDILDYSKINSNKLELENISVNLYEEIKSCAQLFSLKCEEKGILLETLISDELKKTCVKGDPVRLNQVLNNLVSNAVKFTNKGKIGLKAEVVNSCEKSIKVDFSISDTGKGIQEENLKIIFDPFTQADNTVTREFGGTGLGLTITKNIIDLFGGELQVYSHPGEGSLFTFSIEFEKCTGKPKQKKINLKNLNIPIDLKVLLVEDNPLNQVYAQSVLEKYVSQITIANNGQEAIEIIEEVKKFDIILMDIQMPVMDGLECTRKLRSKGFNIPIVALTANAFKEDQKLYLDSGMNTYLSKPYSEPELINKIAVTTGVKNEVLSSEIKPSKNDKLPAVMYKLFVEEMTRNIGLFKEYVANENLPAINKLAHKIKSNLKMFDLGEHIPLCMKIEKSGKMNELEINHLCSSIEAKIEEIKHSM